MARPRIPDEVKRLRGTLRPDRSATRPLPLHVRLGWRTKAELRASWASPAGRRDLREWATYLPGTRPESWWYAAAPEPLRRGEAQPAYLARLDLFLPGEAKRVPPEAFARRVPGLGR